MTTPLPTPRYLVTGCAGFIGAAVTRRLLDASCHVVGLDNLNNAYDPALKHLRLESLRPYPHFQFHRLDVTGIQPLIPLFASPALPASTRPFDAVIHLAARAGVRASVDDPRLYVDTNVAGTSNLLQLCRDFHVPKFVLASTSSVYGAAAGPCPEDAPANQPLSPYAATKKAAELLAYAFHHLHPLLDVSVVRYFTVYGPAGRPDMSIFRFIEALRAGRSIPVYGDGLQTRDFTYIDDIAAGTVAALAPCGYQVYNLGGDSPVTVLHLVNSLARLLGCRPHLIHEPRHPADVLATWADIAKARNHLGWSPAVALDEGLRRTVAWHREHLPPAAASSNTHPEPHASGAC